MTYNRKTNVVRYANAGHTTVSAILKANQEEIPLPSIDPVLGIIKDHQYRDKTIKVKSGDRFYLYTDGIPEARSPDGEFLGQDLVVDLILGNYFEKDLTIQVDTILSSIYEYCQTFSQEDDRTFLIAEIKGVSEEERGSLG
jgi:phosphoserine phosphatase RsbU/P